MLELPISTSQAARQVGVSPSIASVLIRTHQIEVVRLQGNSRFVGLMPASLERLREVSAPFAANRKSCMPLSNIKQTA